MRCFCNCAELGNNSKAKINPDSNSYSGPELIVLAIIFHLLCAGSAPFLLLSFRPSFLPFFPFAGSALFPCAGSALVRCAGSALVPCAGSARVLGAGSAPCQLQRFLSLHLQGLPALPWHGLHALPSSLLPFLFRHAGSALVSCAGSARVLCAGSAPCHLRGFFVFPSFRIWGLGTLEGYHCSNRRQVPYRLGSGPVGLSGL